ncbi:MAG: S1 RNA-binding domain-containing protein [Sorangiineae bacterium]|nr:S1 RNA-binding domain-containing protein [Polyangiaceae bacterium]MEB2321017.1 S1 RNA-binding domain-containing protein [Sorangiineae bacterium]
MPPKDDFASLMEASLATAGSRVRRRLEPGEIVEGTVIQIAQDSVFIDVGAAADARIERGELTDARGELRVKVGDRVRATVIDATSDAPRLALSIGRGGQADTAMLELARESGAPVEGHVTRAVNAGLEIELSGARAFCPASQVELGRTADLGVYEGQTLEFKILEIREGGRNIIVSRRALLEDERRARLAEAEERLTPGTDLDGVVVSTQKHGAIVDVGGVEGFVHISELSHSRVDRVEDIVREGETVAVRVLAVEQSPKGLRVRLSMKARAQPVLAPEPARDEILKGKVVRLANFGVFVETPKGEGLIPTRELGLPPGSDHRRACPVGTELDVVLLSRDPASGKQRFSVRGVEGVEERRNFREFSGASAKSGGLGSFGDLFRKRLGLPAPPPVREAPAPAPSREAPSREAPASEAPASEAPASEAPASEAPPPPPRAERPATPAAPPRPPLARDATSERRGDPPGVVRRRKA